MEDMTHPFRQICDEWEKKVERASRYKHDNFGASADAATNLYSGPLNYMWDNLETNQPQLLDGAGSLPRFRIQVNRIFEAVALYGPSLIHQIPNVEITPKEKPVVAPESLGIFPDMQDPEMMMQYQQYIMQHQAEYAALKSNADMCQFYLTWLQGANNKLTQSRRAVEEAIVAGMGGLYTEIYQPPGSEQKYPRSRFINQRRIVWDADARHWEEITWMAVMHVEPLNRVSEKFGIPIKDLEKHSQKSMSRSMAMRDTRQAVNEIDSNRKEKTHDLLCYWEIFSKNGFGQFLNRGSDKDYGGSRFNETLEKLGRFTKIVVAPGVPFPLNIPSASLFQETEEQTIVRAQWDIPFWKDENCAGGWPYTPLYFYEQSACTYPMGIMRSVMGEIEFVNYIMSHLADRVAASCDTIVGVGAHVIEDFKEQMRTQTGAYKVIKTSITDGGKVSDAIQFLNSIDVNMDVWRMLTEVMEMIDKGTGLTALMYGESKVSHRSATESELKGQSISVRPDDMASKTENFLSNVAKKEAMAAHWALEVQDYVPVLGDLAASIYEQKVLSQPIDYVTNEFTYTIEAGSARRPNMATKQRSLTELGQTMMPVWTQMAASGQVQPLNAYMEAVGKTLQLDTSPFLIQPPPPPPPEANQGAMEEQKHQQEMFFNEETHEQEMDHEEDKMDMELKRMAMPRPAAQGN